MSGANSTKRSMRSAQSSVWNAGRRELLGTIADRTIRTPPDGPDGWLVSRHSDIRSGYTTQSRLRKLYPRLVFRVLNTGDADVPWNGTVYCRRREDGE